MNVTSEDTLGALPRAHIRVRHGMRRTENWVQLFKFLCVGGTGYALNLAIFTICAEVLGIHHLAAATCAFVVAVTNNFWLNRHWTFGAGDGHAGFQAARFFAVSVAAFLFSLVVLQLLVVSVGAPKVLAQAISVAAATPLNFIGNKMWSFGDGAGRSSKSRSTAALAVVAPSGVVEQQARVSEGQIRPIVERLNDMA
jgi:dolichol-phosphate mannosyltransferase